MMYLCQIGQSLTIYLEECRQDFFHSYIIILDDLDILDDLENYIKVIKI